MGRPASAPCMRSTRSSSGTTRAAAARRRAVRYAISLSPSASATTAISLATSPLTPGIAKAFEPAIVRALAGVRDHHGGPAGAETFGGQAVGVGQLTRVVAVGFDDVPAEGKPVVYVRSGHDFEDGAVDAEAVVVQGDDEVLHTEIGGKVARFVSHAFLGFGIARDDERAGGEPARAVQGGEAQAGGNAVAAGTGGSIGERVVALHVAARSAPFAEAGEILGIDRQVRVVPGERIAIAAQRLVDERQHGVKQRAAVTGRPDHAIASGGLGMPRAIGRAH